MGLGDFIKDNAKQGMKDLKTPMGAGIGAVFMADDLKNLATGEDRLKSIWNILKNIVGVRYVMHASFANMFSGMGKGLKSVLASTGSLEAALKKLAKMQELQKVFAPFVGGAEQAKRKVAELTNLANSRGLRFDSVANAAKNLMVLSRGAMGTAKDIDKLADIAHFTGESIDDLADVTARLYATLREGGAISGVTEEMRAMNMVSAQSAERLAELQRTGATMGEVMDQARQSIEDFKGGMSGATEEVRIATEAFEAAKKRMAEGAGSAWVADDVENTKNYTAALNALAPVVKTVSDALAILFNGFSTTTSSVVKAIAQFGPFQAAIKVVVGAFVALAAVVSAWGGAKLVSWFWELGKAAKASSANVVVATASMRAYGASLVQSGTAMGGWIGWAKKMAGQAIELSAKVGLVRVALTLLSVAMKAMAFFTLASMVLALVGAIKDWYNSSKKAADEMARFEAEVKKSGDAMRKQIGEVETLSQMHDKLAEALANVTDAQEAYDKAVAGGDKDEIKKAKISLDDAKKSSKAAVERSRGKFFLEDAEIQGQVDAAARSKARREQAYQEKMSASSPEAQAVLRNERLAELRKEANLAATGVRAEERYSAQQKEADIAVKRAENKLANSGNVSVDKKTEMKVALAKAQADRAMVGMSAETMNKPIDQLTSTEAMAMFRKTRDQRYLKQHGIAKDREKNLEGTEASIQALTAEQEQARRDMSERYAQQSSAADIAGLESEGYQRNQDARKLRIKELDRQMASAKGRGDTSRVNELRLEKQGLIREGGMEARDFTMDNMARGYSGQIKQMELDGDFKGARRVRNAAAALDAYRSNLAAGMSPMEAQAAAGASVIQDTKIRAKEDYIAAQSATVADSMRSIGGGGGVATSYATMEDLAKEQTDLLADMKTSIMTITLAVQRAKAIAIEE